MVKKNDDLMMLTVWWDISVMISIFKLGVYEESCKKYARRTKKVVL